MQKPLDANGHAYPGDLTDHSDPEHGGPDGLCVDCVDDPRTDYDDEDFGGVGYYRVWYRRAQAPSGPHASIPELAQATNLSDYPADGYVLHWDGRVLGSVPSLNPDDLVDSGYEYEVSVRNTFYARDSEHAVRQMVDWLNENAGQTMYRVNLAGNSNIELIDAEDV